MRCRTQASNVAVGLPASSRACSPSATGRGHHRRVAARAQAARGSACQRWNAAPRRRAPIQRRSIRRCQRRPVCTGRPGQCQTVERRRFGSERVSGPSRQHACAPARRSCARCTPSSQTAIAANAPKGKVLELVRRGTGVIAVDQAGHLGGGEPLALFGAQLSRLRGAPERFSLRSATIARLRGEEVKFENDLTRTTKTKDSNPAPHSQSRAGRPGSPGCRFGAGKVVRSADVGPRWLELDRSEHVTEERGRALRRPLQDLVQARASRSSPPRRI